MTKIQIHVRAVEIHWIYLLQRKKVRLKKKIIFTEPCSHLLAIVKEEINRAIKPQTNTYQQLHDEH